MTNPFKVLYFAVLAPLFLAAPAIGAPVTWDATATTSDVNHPFTQISTAGTLVTAVAFSSSPGYGNASGAAWPGPYPGNGPQTVGGVLFDCFTLAGGGTSVALSTHASIGFDAGGFIYGTIPATTYADLLSGGMYVSDGGSATHPLVFTGLTSGQSYQLQIWSSYWGSPNNVRLSVIAPTYDSLTDSWHAVGESPTVNGGVVYGGADPQYVMGTFTAVGTTQTLYWYGDAANYGLLGGFQLRAVPEPSTVALGALGACAILFRLRRRHA